MIDISDGLVRDAKRFTVLVQHGMRVFVGAGITGTQTQRGLEGRRLEGGRLDYRRFDGRRFDGRRLEGRPADVVRVVEEYSRWLAQSDLPKLFVNAEPGSILVGRQREICRAWPNQTEVTVKGTHFIQEDSPDEIGAAVADFVRRIRG